MKVVQAVHETNPALVLELKQLLAMAKAGELRGMIYVAHQSDNGRRFGNEGEYSLADYALGIKMLELGLDAIIAGGGEPTDA